MPTENPKISAYVPQVVYDRFKQFQEERQISMSQAVTELIAEYFGINLKLEITNQFTSELPERVGQIEQELKNLKQLCLELSEKFGSLETTSRLNSGLLHNAMAQASISQLPSEPQNEPLNDPVLQVTPLSELSSRTLSESESRLNSEPPLQLNLVEYLEQKKVRVNIEPQSKLKDDSQESLEAERANINGELQSSLNDELLEDDVKFSPELLAQRLDVSQKYIGNQKTDLTREKFTEWTTKRDPDGIGWKLLKENRRVYYVPAQSLSNEIKSRLLLWQESNSAEQK